MNKGIFRYIEPTLFFALLAVTFVFQSYSSLYLIKDFNWLAFLDHDLVYQIELFLLNMEFPGIERLNSYQSDYGSELWLLIPIYKFYELFVSDPEPIHAYQVLTFVHLCCGISALILLRSLIKRNQDNLISSSLLLGVIVSSPLVVIYLSFIKPDPNVVLLCLLASFLSLQLFHERGESRWMFFALAAAALGAAIKWWGLFVLFPAMYAGLSRDERRSGIFELKHIYTAIIISSVIVSVSYFLVVKNAVAVLIKRGEAIFDPAYIAGLPAAEKLLYQTIIFLHGSAGIAVSAAVFIALTAVCCALVKKMSRYSERSGRDKKGGHKAIKYIFIFTEVFFVFTALCLILEVPFLLTKQLAYSLYVFSKSLIFSSHHSYGSDLPGLLANIERWLSDMWKHGCLFLFILSFAAFGIYSWLRRINGQGKNFLINTLLVYLGPLILFLFIFIVHTSDSVQAMLFILFGLFIAVCFSDILKNLSGLKRTCAILLMLMLVISQAAWQSFMTDFQSVDTLYTYRQNLDADIADLNNQLLNATGAERKDGNELLFFCKRAFPVDKKLNYRQLDTGECSSPEQLGRTLRPGSFLILTEKQRKRQFSAAAGLLLDSEKISFLSTLRSKKYTIEGFMFDYEAYVYSVN